MNKINVNGPEINVVSRNNADYICITDMLKKSKTGNSL